MVGEELGFGYVGELVEVGPNVLDAGGYDVIFRGCVEAEELEVHVFDDALLGPGCVAV